MELSGWTMFSVWEMKRVLKNAPSLDGASMIALIGKMLLWSVLVSNHIFTIITCAIIIKKMMKVVLHKVTHSKGSFSQNFSKIRSFGMTNDISFIPMLSAPPTGVKRIHDKVCSTWY